MPEQHQRSAELEVIYGNRFDHSEDYRNCVWKALMRDWFQAHVPADSTVLDLGCGYGQFINNVVCARKYAMDLNPVSKSKLNPDVTFLSRTAPAVWNLPDDGLDVVFSSNFFEHLLSKADLAKTVRGSLSLLKKRWPDYCDGAEHPVF